MIKTIILLILSFFVITPLATAYVHFCVLQKNYKRLNLAILMTLLWIISYYIVSKFQEDILKYKLSFPFFLAGIIILAITLYIEIATRISLGSLKILGIDSKKDKKSSEKIISSGIYKYARHPRYVEHPLLFLGISLILQNIFFLFFSLYIFIGFFITSRLEEKELTKRYGKEYINYAKKTPYFFINIKIIKQKPIFSFPKHNLFPCP